MDESTLNAIADRLVLHAHKALADDAVFTDEDLHSELRWVASKLIDEDHQTPEIRRYLEGSARLIESRLRLRTTRRRAEKLADELVDLAGFAVGVALALA